MNTNKYNGYPDFLSLARRAPRALAQIRGSGAYPSIRGSVRFYQTSYGVIVWAQITGLPDPGIMCQGRIFAFHIHEGQACGEGNAKDPFPATGTHYDPYGCDHPYHAGDMPPLLGARGKAFSAFLTDRFTLREIVGRTVVIHALPDDFKSQPSGASGEKIACGKIIG